MRVLRKNKVGKAKSVKVRLKCVTCGDYFYRYRSQVRKHSKYCSVDCYRAGPHYSSRSYDHAGGMPAGGVFSAPISFDRNSLRVVERLQKTRPMNRSAAVRMIVKEWARMKAEQNVRSLASVAALNR